MTLRTPTDRVCRLLKAAVCGAMMSMVSGAHAFQLDLSPSPPQTIEDERHLRFTQHYDCAAGKSDARVCEMLEQQARQEQVDAVRRDTSPMGMPSPVNPNPLSKQGIPLPGGYQ